MPHGAEAVEGLLHLGWVKLIFRIVKELKDGTKKMSSTGDAGALLEIPGEGLTKEAGSLKVEVTAFIDSDFCSTVLPE